MKAYVLVAWVLDTIHEVFLLKAAYVYLVKDIADPLALEQEISCVWKILDNGRVAEREPGRLKAQR